jgi:hypothetical protein
MAAEEGETDVGDIAKLVESALFDQNHALVIGVGVWTLAAGKPIQVAWHDESSDLPAQPSQRVTLEIMCGVGGGVGIDMLTGVETACYRGERGLRCGGRHTGGAGPQAY